MTTKTDGVKLPVLFDFDVVAYRSSCTDGGLYLQNCLKKADEIVEKTMLDCRDEHFFSKSSYLGFLTGKGNFRYDFLPDYKANRKDKEKPKYLQAVREYLIEKYDAEVTNGQEADDALGITATQLNDKCIIASVDKDLLMIPCWHYNLMHGTLEKVEPEDALKKFYTQILTGDTVDNINGLYRVGPKKAESILKGLDTEQEMWEACVKSYEAKGRTKEEAYNNAVCLYMRRYENQIWEEPK